MTKDQRRTLAILVPFIVALMCFFYFDQEESATSESHHKTSQVKVVSGPDKTLIRSPASLPDSTPKSVANTTKPGLSHPVWKEKLETTLKAQGGNFITKIEIETLESFDWKVGKVDVRVDSIKVKLENVKGQRSSFRAIVDAKSGKILQTWDAPVVDNFTAKSTADIKIDPRYHND